MPVYSKFCQKPTKNGTNTEPITWFFSKIVLPFMRSQSLAQEMESQQAGCGLVSLLYTAPTHKQDFRKITPPHLIDCGIFATDIWNKLVNQPDRLKSISTESLFGPFDTIQYPEMARWKEYIKSRYRWVMDN